MNDMFEGSNFVSFVKSDLICRHGDFKFRKIIDIRQAKVRGENGFYILFGTQSQTFHHSALCFYSNKQISG